MVEYISEAVWQKLVGAQFISALPLACIFPFRTSVTFRREKLVNMPKDAIAQPIALMTTSVSVLSVPIELIEQFATELFRSNAKKSLLNFSATCKALYGSSLPILLSEMDTKTLKDDAVRCFLEDAGPGVASGTKFRYVRSLTLYGNSCRQKATENVSSQLLQRCLPFLATLRVLWFDFDLQLADFERVEWEIKRPGAPRVLVSIYDSPDAWVNTAEEMPFWKSLTVVADEEQMDAKWRELVSLE